MNVVFSSRVESPERWLPLLEQALPQDRFFAWPELNGGDADVALVATPHEGFFRNFPSLRLVQSIWMGVDALLAVAETGSVLAAPDRLKIPRATVRRRLDTLEARVGAPLVHRGPSGALLTEAGRSVATHARAILDETAALLASAREAGSRQPKPAPRTSPVVSPLLVGRPAAPRPTQPGAALTREPKVLLVGAQSVKEKRHGRARRVDLGAADEVLEGHEITRRVARFDPVVPFGPFDGEAAGSRRPARLASRATTLPTRS
jgi:DNA-binding transcriptional LysR family regulator